MKNPNETTSRDLLTHVTNIVCTILQNNSIRPEEVPALIEAVHKSYKKIADETPQKRNKSLTDSTSQDFMIDKDNMKTKPRKRH